MPKFRDLTGQKFGSWTVLRWTKKVGQRQFWFCACECGTQKEVIGASLTKGVSRSCGCKGKAWCTTHGMEGTRTYGIWAGMKQRCQNPKYHGYRRYGGRGIKVCKEWQSFEGFFADIGEAPEGRSLGRIDNNKDYEKSNCRWETPTQQQRNRSNTTYITYKGATRPLAEWGEMLGISHNAMKARRRLGWSIERLVTDKPKEPR